MTSVCPIMPIAPAAVQAAKAREWPTAPISRGAHQQPTKKPTKCAEPSSPTCAVVKPRSSPESASSGPSPPEESCRSATAAKSAAKDRIRRIARSIALRGRPSIPIPTRRVAQEPAAPLRLAWGSPRLAPANSVATLRRLLEEGYRMKTIPLGRDGPEVSEICLGTMTWGTQNTAPEAHAQIERAAEAGCTFMDTAEMYPVNPVRAETAGRTEAIVGDWFARTGRRDEWVLATKIAGPSQTLRDGRGITPETLPEAVHGSLRRLRTDRIDLYQLHWPQRGSYHFRQCWDYDPTGQDTASVRQHMADVSGALARLVEAGDILQFGLSNESAWGTVAWNAAAERTGGPRVASVQNEYSLLCRLYDTDMAETAHHEGAVLLAFSPLAAGLLTGKYRGGAVPEGSRMSLNPELGGRRTDRAFEAVAAYLGIAERHGLDPVGMAIAFCRSRPFPTIPIIGATDLEQLDRALGAAELTLSEDVLQDIAAAHNAHPMPY